MDSEMTALSLDDPFTFSCARHVPCFNECCRDLNQFLTPYDIIRLKHHLGLSSGEFLERYTVEHAGPETGLPVMTLKPDYAAGLACPFVSPEGCRVYTDRPSSCRTYPLARLVSRSRETGEMTEQFVLMKESHCLGFCEEKTQTVREWIADQEIDVYNRMNDLLMELISLKNRFRPGPMDLKSKYLFTMALYDLDHFRTQIFDKGLLGDFPVDSRTLNAIKADDVELLKLGIRWLKKKFFDVD